MTLRGDFELAEMLWDVAEPCLTDDEEARLRVALHTGEVMVAILSIVQTLVRVNKAVPRRLLGELDECLGVRMDVDPHGFPVMAQVHLRLLVSRLQPTDDPCDLGRYGAATLTHVILDDAQVVEASAERQADAIREWLRTHQPSPALRADLRACGFGDLLATRNS